MATAITTALEKILFAGHGTDDLGNPYIKLAVAGSKIDLPPYSIADLLEPRRRVLPELGQAGCRLLSRSSQTTLIKMLEDYEPDGPADFLIVPRLGSLGSYYVRPRSIIGQPPLRVERALGSLDQDMLRKYRSRGSLGRWQKQIGNPCSGNSRLMFAASLACTGPILPFVKGPRTGGFQITGPAETGKTTAAMVAGSVWGCHRDSARAEKGFAENWNTTLNTLDETAQTHCDALLILDETNLAGTDDQSRANAVLNGSFRLAEGSKRKRLNEPETAAWRLYFLSTSNLSLDELAAAGGVQVDEQHRGRLIDVALPQDTGAGIYEDLHGFADGAALTDVIKNRCRTTFGAPGYRLVQRIYKNKQTVSEAKSFLSKRRAAYIRCVRSRAAKIGAKPLERSTARFATVYAAGCLAIHLRVFTWRRPDLLRAILACQFDSLPSSTTAPTSPLRRRLSEYCARHRDRFVDLDRGRLDRARHTLGSAPGYLHTHKGQAWLYLTAKQLEAIIGAGRAASLFKQELAAEGLLARTGDRLVVQRPIYCGPGNKGYEWVHALPTALLDNVIVGP
ncbi:DUF927 domain-containing protein [Bradyrhizobium sp. CCGUVB14]|uniref:DUF927 domain-containing protein n=1 Tax=Bradyrhizobium sp. CCGUVB14 TaxID=2949628 RepID=UPI0020B250B3|nr:DUF927 domain-containing protein [Bradyrhizobium sp. CCGUVB14]MCP3441982.1 DUF927 domain-containing protein [Bradyrhizobium sp. CCGUVB14]